MNTHPTLEQRIAIALQPDTAITSADLAALIDEAEAGIAKAEKELVLYSSLNNEQIVTLIDAFRKKYPSIKPSFYRATSERILQRLITEAKAGRYAVDVLTAAGFQLHLSKPIDPSDLVSAIATLTGHTDELLGPSAA